KKFGRSDRIRIAFSSSVIAGSIVLLFSVLGQEIMTYFYISINAVKVGGGLLLLYIAFQMILSGQLNYENNPPESRRSIIVSPLAIPMLAGPGSMTFGMISYLKLQGAEKFYLITAIVTAVVAGALLLSISAAIDRLLGQEFTKGLEKIMAIIVSFISLEMIMSGVKGYFY
ncbi:MAG TPA: MarC family protein, partial [Spirochaetota bacterium]|nr:MarC family protein [Spirochaetota bacterium]